MGYKWEVHAWKKAADSDAYAYEKVYGGNWFLAAMFHAVKLRHQGVACVKIEWR